MITIHNKQELVSALKNREAHIIARGEMAKIISRGTKARKASVIGGAIIAVAGVAAVPFTGGTSSGLAVIGAHSIASACTATALTVGSTTISTTELVILCGCVLGMAGILKGCSIYFNPDGSVTITPSYRTSNVCA